MSVKGAMSVGSQAIELGKPVVSRDGKRIGSVDRLVLDADTREVTAVIVHQGLLLTRDRIVERALIEQIDEDGTVHLSLTAEEADQLPIFIEAEFQRLTPEEARELPYVLPGTAGITALLWAKPVPGAAVPEVGTPIPVPVPEAVPPSPAVTVERNLPPDTLVIGRGTAVQTHDGKVVGDVEEVVLNDDGEVAAVLVRVGWLGRRRLRIPRAWIASVTEETITLSVDRAALEQAQETDEEA